MGGFIVYSTGSDFGEITTFECGCPEVMWVEGGKLHSHWVVSTVRYE